MQISHLLTLSLADRKYVHKHVSSLAAQMLYKRQLMTDNLLRASSELVI